MSHSHSHQVPSPAMQATERRVLGIMVSVLVPIAVLTVAALVWLWPHDVASHIRSDSATVMAPGVTMPKGTVTQVEQASCDGMTGSSPTDPRPCAKVSVRLDEGPDQGTVQQVPMTAAVYASGVKPGDHVKLYRTPSPQDGRVSYQWADFQRGVPLLFFTALLVVAVVVVARWRGLASLLGLGFALLVLWKFLFPALVSGHDPVLVGVVASVAIMFVVLYAAHGFSARTTTALLGTLFGIALSAGLGVLAAHWAHLTGVASEDDFLLSSAAPDLNLQAAVMCGVVIAGLGVLNDVTITQASAVWELADQGRSRRNLFGSAMRIGRDHIASTIYTTAFATAGAILSVLLLLSIYRRPVLEVATGEMFAGELVRTLVGAIGLVLAVPLTTAIAVAAVTAGLPKHRRDELRPQPRTERVTPSEPVRRIGAAATVNQTGAGATPAKGSRARRAASSSSYDQFRRPQGPDEV